MGNQAGRNGETEEARAESGTVEATVRRKRGSRKGRNRDLSSQSLKRKGSKESGSEEGRRPKKKGTKETGKRASTGKSAAGDEPGRMKENEAENRVSGIGRKPWETRVEGRGDLRDERSEGAPNELARGE